MVDSLSKAFKDSNLSLPADFVEGLQHFLRGTKAAPHNAFLHGRTLKPLLLPDAIDSLKDSRWGLSRKILRTFPPKFDNVYEEENIGSALACMVNARGLIKGNIHGDDEIIEIIKALEEVPPASFPTLAQYAPVFIKRSPTQSHGHSFERDVIRALSPLSIDLIQDLASMEE